MKEYLKMLKSLIFIFFAVQVAQAILSRSRKPAAKQPTVEEQPSETAYPSAETAEADPAVCLEQE